MAKEIDIDTNAVVIQPLKFGVIVGHEKKAQGAVFGKSKISEYQFNKQIAAMIVAACELRAVKCVVQLRDGVGITGAYKEILKQKPDAIIELHFNAFNGKATGTQTLCTTNLNDIAFANHIHAEVCACFGRKGLSRGVTGISRDSRGGGNVYAAGDTPNCLIEPFFGDNSSEENLAMINKEKYALSIVSGFIDWAVSVKLLKPVSTGKLA